MEVLEIGVGVGGAGGPGPGASDHALLRRTCTPVHSMRCLQVQSTQGEPAPVKGRILVLYCSCPPPCSSPNRISSTSGATLPSTWSTPWTGPRAGPRKTVSRPTTRSRAGPRGRSSRCRGGRRLRRSGRGPAGSRPAPRWRSPTGSGDVLHDLFGAIARGEPSAAALTSLQLAAGPGPRAARARAGIASRATAGDGAIGTRTFGLHSGPCSGRRPSCWNRTRWAVCGSAAGTTAAGCTWTGAATASGAGARCGPAVPGKRSRRRRGD